MDHIKQMRKLDDSRKALLTDADVQALRAISTGLTLEEAACRFDFSAEVLRHQMREICHKLDVHTPIEAVASAAQDGLI